VAAGIGELRNMPDLVGGQDEHDQERGQQTIRDAALVAFGFLRVDLDVRHAANPSRAKFGDLAMETDDTIPPGRRAVKSPISSAEARRGPA
jgi:hypothetical protein